MRLHEECILTSGGEVSAQRYTFDISGYCRKCYFSAVLFVDTVATHTPTSRSKGAAHSVTSRASFIRDVFSYTDLQPGGLLIDTAADTGDETDEKTFDTAFDRNSGGLARWHCRRGERRQTYDHNPTTAQSAEARKSRGRCDITRVSGNDVYVGSCEGREHLLCVL